MTDAFNRRRFLKQTTTLTAAALAAPALLRAEEPAPRPIRVGFIGVGGRGTGLLDLALSQPGITVPAVCDTNPANLNRALEMVKQRSGAQAEGYGDSETIYQKLLERDDLDAVIIATPWQWHTPMAVDAMKAGKYAGVEVPCSQTLEECWQLIDTHESTGVPCMMLENWSFRRDNLAVLKIIREGLMGQIVHCHCAHSHDCIDHWFFDPQGNDRWPAKYLIERNTDQYPTHSLGPVLSWMDINRGDAFATIAATATGSWGINEYFARRFGPDHPGAKRTYAQGDIVTTTIKTHGGKTIVVNYDMQLPRPYDNRWTIQGTLGLYNEQREAIYLAGVSPAYHQWEPFAPYQEKYDHAWWKQMQADAGGHGGTDYLELQEFFRAVREKTQTPIDVYDSVVMSCLVPFSGQSIAQGSVPVECPDFTRGRWKTLKPTFAVEG